MASYTGTIKIRINSAKGLADMDSMSGASDPYAVVKLNGKEIARTKVVKDNANPEW